MIPTTLDAYNLLQNGILALARAERNGITCDVDYCKKQIIATERRVERLLGKVEQSELVKQWKQIYRNKYNINSSDQLADVLFNHMKLESTKKTASGKPATDEEALEATNLPELQMLLEAKKLTKAKDTYLLGFLNEQVDGVIHTNFNLHSTRSYRPSTDSPNLANVPTRNPEIKKLVRGALKARPGHKLICADFKGIEVSIAYCYHKDPEMGIYLTDITTDMHRDMAMKLYCLSLDEMIKPARQSAKGSFVFPEFYGDWWKSCAASLWQEASLNTHTLKNGKSLQQHLKDLGYTTLTKYEKLVEDTENWMWYEKWPIYTKWKEERLAEYYEKGYFTTLTGFTCRGVMDRKQVINYPIQGSAFHCMLQCIIWMDEIMRKEKWRSRICNQIYDDLMLDVHPDEEQKVIDTLNYLMTVKIKEHWAWVIAPLGVEIEATPVDGSWYLKSEKYVLQ